MFGEIELPDLATAMDWPAVQLELAFGDGTPLVAVADPTPEIAPATPAAAAPAPPTPDPAPADPAPVDVAPVDVAPVDVAPVEVAPVLAIDSNAPVFSDPPAVAPMVDLASFGDNGFDDAAIAAIGRSLSEAHLFL